MTHFVLVHGAWHGGWAWQPVRALLEAVGQQVTSPTLPGLGADDDPTGITLHDCVDALVRHVESADLQDVTLVGHSWGGIVAGGASPRLAGRLRHLIMVSAFVPRVGEALVDLVPAEHVGLFEQLVSESVARTVLPPLSVFQDMFMNDAALESSALAFSLMRPQPWRTFTDPLAPEMDFHSLDVPKTFIVAQDDKALPAEQSWVPRFSDALGGDLQTIAGSHEAMLTQPAALATSLLKIVR